MSFFDRIKTMFDTQQPASNESSITEETPSISSVDIEVNTKVREKYIAGWQDKTRTEPITEIVIHGTGGGGSVTDLLQWMYDGQFAANYIRGIGLFHYAIGRDGKITEVLNPDYWVYHSTSGYHDKQTIGIELMNPTNENTGGYTDEQYEAVINLIFNNLVISYPSITNITSHKYNIIKYNGGRSLKACPGSQFDWSKLDAGIKNSGYAFNINDDLRYDIKKA